MSTTNNEDTAQSTDGIGKSNYPNDHETEPHNETGTNQCEEIRVDESSILEHSYEILSNTYLNLSTDSTRVDYPVGPVKDTSMQHDGTNAGSDAPKSDGGRGSVRRSVKKPSSGFLSKIQSSTSSSSITNDQANHSANLPSSFANALSTISSSLTSSFNLGNSSSNNNNYSNTINDGSSTGFIINPTNETSSTSNNTTQILETREQILSKKAMLERKNLINLTKLIVKDLISSSLVVNRTIDDSYGAIHLHNYFTLIDRVLKHGLKQAILSNKSASLWNALDNLPKYLSDKRLTSETVRSLAHTKTPDGKIKAWVRIAMMQKKLPEYFNELLANKNILLKDIYHEFAFMMNEEAQVFAGLIIGVNVIDCNFFVKDDNFDAIDDVIDLSPYLKVAYGSDEDNGEQQSALLNERLNVKEPMESMNSVLDQKNYLEERGKHLETMISSLRLKIKELEEQNSRLEVDAKVNEVRIQKLLNVDKSSSSGFQISGALKGFINSTTDPLSGKKLLDQVSNTNDILSSRILNEPDDKASTLDQSKTNAGRRLLEGQSEPESVDASDSVGYNRTAKARSGNSETERINKSLIEEIEMSRKQIEDQKRDLLSLRERAAILETSYRGALDKIRVLERDLDIQTSMNKDKETTIKIYEKDLREKQGQVESLRASLADAKKITVDLNERLNDSSIKLKDRLNCLNNLQMSLDKWKLENKSLAQRLLDKQTAIKSVTGKLEKATKTIGDLKSYNERINDELNKERKCGQSSSITVETQIAKIGELTKRIEALEDELQELRPQREQLNVLKIKCLEYEQSLEEVGLQLRESRLEVESLKENSSVFLDSQWMDSKQVKNCALCQQTFSVTRRKHHCRLCGNVFCQMCSDNKMELASSSKPARVCDTCHAFLLAKFVRSSGSSSSSSIARTSIA